MAALPIGQALPTLLPAPYLESISTISDSWSRSDLPVRYSITTQYCLPLALPQL